MRQHRSKTNLGGHTAGTARLAVFAFALMLACGIIGYELIMLAWVNHDSYLKIAQAQQAAPALQLAGRGTISGFGSATGQTTLLAGVAKNNGIVERTYPQKYLASHVLGFVGYDGHNRVGQYGLESYYDETLRDSDLVLTIDPAIQAYVETKLQEVLTRYSAPRGTAIVQDPSTGAILAMASSPSYDPNRYGSFDFSIYLNPAVQEEYEPGSSFKSITMAAALDTSAVVPDTTYNDTGVVEVGGYQIRNYNDEANGVQTMRQVLEKSLNTGAAFAQRKTGNDRFLNYVVGFGFGQKTGVDLAGEVKGNMNNLYENRQVNFSTVSFGQGIAVTSLQLINAYSAIANGGKLMRPYVIKEIVHADGSVTATKPQIIGAPITEKTAATLTAMLVDVVDRGFDQGKVTGYDVAGKTGTAQIPDKVNGGYLGGDQYIHDFVGFAPAYAPRFTILIKIKKPQGIKFASRSLSPVFADIAGFLLHYDKIPPTRR